MWAYNALVQPILEYASTVWSPGQKCLCATIEQVQRRAAHHVCGLHVQSGQESVTAMMHRLYWETLENRRKKSRSSYNAVQEMDRPSSHTLNQACPYHKDH